MLSNDCKCLKNSTSLPFKPLLIEYTKCNDCQKIDTNDNTIYCLLKAIISYMDKQGLWSNK